MTTIAYDGKSIAADSQSTLSSEQIYQDECQKLFADVGPFAVLGICGNLQDCRDVIEVVKDFTKIDQIRSLDFESLDWSCCMLAVTNEGSVWHYTGSSSFELQPELPFAVGTGAAYALGAMHHGANAQEAVATAARFDIFTNMNIQVAHLVSPDDEADDNEDETIH